MKRYPIGRCFGFAVAVLCFLAPVESRAQRNINWQINPVGFPSNVSLFVDVEENGAFRRDLKADSFAVSMDEYAGEQGGWILNRDNVGVGMVGTQLLIIVDRSRSYTGEFGRAKKMMKAIVEQMAVDRDQIAIASAPVESGFSEIKMEQPFTSDKNALIQAIDGIKTFQSDDNRGARFCNALSEGLRLFPEAKLSPYRAVVFVSAGADKGEGEGGCVQESFRYGKVPFFSMVFKLDRKYDDPRNAHKIENNSHELAKNTGGRSIFRRSDDEYMQFIGQIWSRIRGQYYLQATFPCYQPMPATEHLSILKVDGQDSEGIKFKATSAPPPKPKITAIYPQSASRKDVDDGKIELTVDGSGFCGPPGAVKLYVDEKPIAVKSQNPFRVVGSLNSGVESGKVSAVNQYGQNGESPMTFEVVQPPKGAEASKALTFLVVGIVLIAAVSLVLVALRSRKASTGAAAPKDSFLSKPQARQEQAGETAAKTIAIGSIKRAWISFEDGTEIGLAEGANTIGREPSCRINLDVMGVSREHASINLALNQGIALIEDLGSTNGTFLGPAGAEERDLKRVEGKQPLSSGDVIWIGGKKLAFFSEN